MSISKPIGVGGLIVCMLLSFWLVRQAPEHADIIAMASVLAGYFVGIAGAYFLFTEILEEAQ